MYFTQGDQEYQRPKKTEMARREVENSVGKKKHTEIKNKTLQNKEISILFQQNRCNHKKKPLVLLLKNLLKNEENECSCIIRLVISQYVRCQLLVLPNAAVQQYFIQSDCLSDFDNPAAGQHEILGVGFLGFKLYASTRLHVILN